MEPFSHIAILPDRARGSTNEVTHPLKDVAPFSLKEQVGYSRLALVTDRSPFPPSPPSATTSYSVPTLPPVLRSGLLKEDATADAACSKLPLECHSKSTQLSCQSKAPDPYYLSHRRITEITNVNQVNSVPVSCETTAANEVEVPKDSSLEEKKEELESRIQVQADVNKELKRLLVASIGSDLQQRVSQVAQERAVAEHRLNTSLQHITESEEELDRLAIECDVWRSKFLASRLMIDELVSWKADVVRKLRESQRALQQLLQEQLEVKRILQASGCLDAGGKNVCTRVEVCLVRVRMIKVWIIEEALYKLFLNLCRTNFKNLCRTNFFLIYGYKLRFLSMNILWDEKYLDVQYSEIS